jgi:hypothetical protein
MAPGVNRPREGVSDPGCLGGMDALRAHNGWSGRRMTRTSLSLNEVDYVERQQPMTRAFAARSRLSGARSC